MILETIYKSRPVRIYKYYAPTLRINCGGGRTHSGNSR